jgi:inosine/xanthosine triphosphate pyrophosphatase family protein
MLNEDKIWLATGNSHKFREARKGLDEYGVQL